MSKPEATHTDENRLVSLWVERLKDGDQKAFQSLVNRFSTKAYATAYRVLQNREDAEEITQSAFLKVWTHARTYDLQKGHFQVWLNTILVRQCLDRLRSAHHRYVTLGLTGDHDLEALPDKSPNAEATLLQKQDSQKLEQALSSLKPLYRAALVVTYLDGFSQKDAAQMMGLSLKGYESTLFRARKALKTALLDSKA